MAHHRRRAAASGLDCERQGRNMDLNRALHRSVFAHLTRRVSDPEHPGRQIAYCELEQRLTARSFRRHAEAVCAPLFAAGLEADT
jgi:hypothetical protein